MCGWRAKHGTFFKIYEKFKTETEKMEGRKCPYGQFKPNSTEFLSSSSKFVHCCRENHRFLLTFQKTTLSVEKNNHFWKYISLGYFPRQTNSFLRTLFKYEDRNPILTWWDPAEACPWILLWEAHRYPQSLKRAVILLERFLAFKYYQCKWWGLK